MREEIHIESVQSRLLAGSVGYVRIKQFQSSTSNELERALDGLHTKEKLRGLILDLRGNPGGLLDQAAKVADRFLDQGVIVSTVGTSEGREQKSASSRGTQPGYPLVVLADGASASASEIVAGALRNHDRAIVVGETTFGKGTVQLVFPRITPDGAALKLTIAQYLMPGDVSIQGVGVAPDIELDPMTAAEMAKEFDIKIYTIGAGTNQSVTYIPNRGYIRNEVDEGTLMDIAKVTDGTYFRANNVNRLKNIYEEIDNLERSEIEVKSYTRYQDLYGWLLIPAAILGIFYEVVSRGILRRKM